MILITDGDGLCSKKDCDSIRQRIEENSENWRSKWWDEISKLNMLIIRELDDHLGCDTPIYDLMDCVKDSFKDARMLGQTSRLWSIYFGDDNYKSPVELEYVDGYKKIYDIMMRSVFNEGLFKTYA